MDYMRVNEINSSKDFMSLKEKWNELLQASQRMVFSTFEWLATWWKYFGHGRKLKLLTVEDHGEIIAIAPLMYSIHKILGFRRGIIEFIGTPDSDYNNFIITKRHSECLKMFIDHLYEAPENWECISLLDIPEKAECLQYLAQVSETLKQVHQCPVLLLPSSYAEFLQNFNYNKRRYFKRNMKRLEHAFTVEFVDYSTPEKVNEGMHILFKLHQKRWQSKGFKGVFADSTTRNFHLELAKTFALKNWLCLYALKLSGEVAAVEYGFRFNSKYYAYLNGFDPEYAHYGVGNLLRLLAIRKFIQEGIVEFDFLRGAEEYKKWWGAVPRWNYQAVITRKGITATIQHWLYEYFWRQGNRLRYVLKIH
jgi:CelD/BcsL family acetyltransferase involved in cellulose biosynthesis